MQLEAAHVQWASQQHKQPQIHLCGPCMCGNSGSRQPSAPPSGWARPAMGAAHQHALVEQPSMLFRLQWPSLYGPKRNNSTVQVGYICTSTTDSGVAIVIHSWTRDLQQLLSRLTTSTCQVAAAVRAIHTHTAASPVEAVQVCNDVAPEQWRRWLAASPSPEARPRAHGTRLPAAHPYMEVPGQNHWQHNVHVEHQHCELHHLEPNKSTCRVC
jgi:hypothetical protein